jgi:anti-sigma B factor antagonist
MKLAVKKTTGPVKTGKNDKIIISDKPVSEAAKISEAENAKPAKTVLSGCAETVIDKKKNYVKLSVSGDITIKTVIGLKKTVKDLIDDKNINIVFDLTNTRYVDSSGLGFFIGTLKTLKEAHGALHITGLNEHIKGLFQLINLTNIFEIFENAKDAVKF